MIIEVIEGAGIIVGTAGGYLKGRLRRAGPSKQPEPICGCKHHLSFHDATTGACRIEISSWYSGGSSSKRQRNPVLCGCHQYVGPRPANEFFTEQINWDATVMKRSDP